MTTDDHKAVKRGNEAKQILESPLWVEAWEAYRVRLIDIIDQADSASTEQVMQAKRLLTAGKAAKAHLERIIVDGAVSAETIRVDEEKRKWWKAQSR